MTNKREVDEVMMMTKFKMGNGEVLDMIVEVWDRVGEILEMMLYRMIKEWAGMDVPANKRILRMGTREVVDMFMEVWDKVGDMVKGGGLWDRGYLEPGYPL